jgi:hypothetical protein
MSEQPGLTALLANQRLVMQRPQPVISSKVLLVVQQRILAQLQTPQGHTSQTY